MFFVKKVEIMRFLRDKLIIVCYEIIDKWTQHEKEKISYTHIFQCLR